MTSHDCNTRKPRTPKICTPKTIDTRSHAFNVGIATDYSPTMAIWLGHLCFWTEHNLSNDKHIYDGLCWMYDTLDAISEKFPYFTRRQIETMINNSVEEGLVAKGNYNHTTYDRTCWYALTPKAYFYFQHLLTEKYLNRLYLSISQKCEMDYTEMRNRFPKNVTPIPDTIPDTIPNKKTTSTRVKEKLVEEKPQEPLVSSSFIFSETTDKNILNQKLSRDERTDDEFMAAVVKHVDNYSDKKYSRLQRANAAVKLLRKLKEDNVLFYPKGETPDDKQKHKKLSKEDIARIAKEREEAQERAYHEKMKNGNLASGKKEAKQERRGTAVSLSDIFKNKLRG